MTRSMTAFARREAHNDVAQLSWELRSVNHRYLDISLRLPEDLRVLESGVRELVNKRLSRGKVDCTLKCQFNPSATTGLEVDAALTQKLAAAAQEVSVHWRDAATPNTLEILRWPGVVQSQKIDMEPLQVMALTLLDEALTDLREAREREGARLQEMIEERLTLLAESVVEVRGRRPEVLRLQRERLEARLADWRETLDPGRLEQEMVIHAQKLDVDEETDRLVAHIAEVRSTLKQKKPVGRRLDFLMQELNREANTLSSKSSDAETTRLSVDMKVLIEQMREQVQNIE